MTEQALLEVKNLHKDYPGFSLRDISFTLPAGYIMGYVGQNGAGKTTTINLITGLCHADKGSVTVGEQSYDGNARAYLDQIGYVGDTSHFPVNFKLKDVRRILKLFYGSFDVEKFNAMAEEWRLPADKKIGDFSRGMKVKLMFAAALARDTRLLILDEATNGLDPVMRAEIVGLLQAYVEDGTHSILFSTHILNDLEQIADYIVFIDDGQVLMNESKDELMDSFLLVRGGTDTLTEQQKRSLIGAEYNAYGFTALVKADDGAAFGRECAVEKPSIDQIVLYTIRQRKGGTV